MKIILSEHQSHSLENTLYLEINRCEREILGWKRNKDADIRDIRKGAILYYTNKIEATNDLINLVINARPYNPFI